MWYFIFALLLGLGSPSGSSTYNGQGTVQTAGDDDDTGGDTGQTVPPPPAAP